MMNCPLGLDEVDRSSCYFWRDKCHCYSIPRPLVRVLAGEGTLLAWPGYGWVTSMDDITLEVLETALTAGFREGLGSIQATFLRNVVSERLRRFSEQSTN